MTDPINLAAGRGYLAIPGPSVIPEAVLRAMHIPAPNIYEGALPDMIPDLVADLKAVARTDGHLAMYIGNGHAVWEASLANVILPGDRVLVPVCGEFARGWAEMAECLGAEPQFLDCGTKTPMEPAQIGAALTEDRDHRIKAVLVVHVDTSTSLKSDVAAIRAAMDAADHPALLMVDCIASLGCDRFEMDDWGVDVMVAGCQKGLMTPPGMGFVFFNCKAAAVRDALPRVSRYWDWRPRANPARFFEYWNGTAPTHHLAGLRSALDMIGTEGIEAVWQRHETLARAIWAACETWSAEGSFAMNVGNPAHRSHAVTALRLDPPFATELRKFTEHRLGLTLGIGLGMAPADDPAWHGFFRLGHMGHVNGHMIMGLLGGIEAGLKGLDLPHGAGALEAAAAVLAGAQP